MEADIVQNHRSVNLKRNIPELHVSLGSFSRIFRLIPVGNGRLRIENLNDHLARSKKALNIIDQHTKVAQRIGQRPGQGRKRQDFACCQFSLNHKNSAYKKSRYGERLGKQIDKRMKFNADICRFQIHLAVIFILLLELLVLILLPGKRLDHPVAFNVLLCYGIQTGKLLPQHHKHGMNNSGEKACDKQNEGRNGCKAKHQLYVH